MRRRRFQGYTFQLIGMRMLAALRARPSLWREKDYLVRINIVRLWRALVFAAVCMLAWPAALQAQSAAPSGIGPPAGAAAAAPAALPVGAAQDNPYGLKAVWAQGDFVAKGTLLILLLMSVGSWYVIVTKLFEQARIERQARALGDDFWATGSVRQSADTLAADSAFRYIAERALEGARKHEGLPGAIDFDTWVSMGIQRAVASVQNRLQAGLALLATVGSTAPFVGLFGTVWGIYNALVSIGMSGQASIDKVAGPVGEALIMTAIGLGVAVPAVLGYNWLVRRNRLAMQSVQAFGGELHAVVLATMKRR